MRREIAARCERDPCSGARHGVPEEILNMTILPGEAGRSENRLESGKGTRPDPPRSAPTLEATRLDNHQAWRQLEMEVIIDMPPHFPLGHLLITATANNQLCLDDVMRCLKRHTSGDCGDLCTEDPDGSDYALHHDLLLLSAYADSTASSSGSSPKPTDLQQPASASPVGICFPSELRLL